MNKIENEIIKEIPFYDLDPMNVVWHGNYVKYCEIARCALLDKIGYNYIQLRKDGFVIPVAKMDMKFIKPAKFASILRIKAILLEYEPALNIKYEIYNDETNDLVFKANTMQIYVEEKTQTSVYTIPENFKERIIKCLKG